MMFLQGVVLASERSIRPAASGSRNDQRRNAPAVLPRHRGKAALAVLLLGAALSGCATDPVGSYLGGFGDPVVGAALYAPRNLGNTSRWDGQPAQAALAAAQLEFLASELRASPRFGPEVNPAVLQQLDRARAEMRSFLGIAPDAPPPVVITGLRNAAAALRVGSQARAEAALSSPAFTAGPLVTLARLNAMPRLPQTSTAAGMAASEMMRLQQPRRL